MVDFRYLLVTVVAVFLALGIGVLMGNLGLNLPQDIENRIDSVEARNDELRTEIDELNRAIALDREFGEAVERWFVGGALAGEKVVVFEVDGSDGSTVDDLRDEVESAGGEITATVTFKDKLTLDGALERDELALVLNSTSSDADDLRTEAAAVVGEAAAAAVDTPGVGPQGRLQEVLDDLERSDYVAVSTNEDTNVVPVGASFLVIAGDENEPPFDTDEFVIALIGALTQRDAAVLAAEPGASSWGIVGAVRDDGEVNDSVATVDQADTIAGQIAVVMALDLATEGRPGHYGVESGADSIIPLPSPGD